MGPHNNGEPNPQLFVGRRRGTVGCCYFFFFFFFVLFFWLLLHYFKTNCNQPQYLEPRQVFDAELRRLAGGIAIGRVRPYISLVVRGSKCHPGRLQCAATLEPSRPVGPVD